MAYSPSLHQREQDKFTGTTQDNTRVKVDVFNQLVPEIFDYIALGYTGSDITTVTYKTGGAGGTTVATLTLGYTGSNLTSVTKS